MDDPLFSGLRLKGAFVPNRIALSPMCQYSARDGLPNEWHFRHYVERGIGGAGLVMLESTAVLPEGRITPYDLGLWNGEQEAALSRLAAAVRATGAAAGIQLNHAGRKASTDAPWKSGGPLTEGAGGWRTKAMSALPFDDSYPMPEALSEGGLEAIVAAFAAAASRAVRAGFDIMEIHAAHGYLLHQSLSPLSNRREDGWGEGTEGRFRLTLETAEAVRRAMPEGMPLFLRLSATDWAEGGWDLDGSIALVRELKAAGVDLVDVTTGGLVPKVKIPVAPGYQVRFSEAIRKEAGIPVGAVGLITELDQARGIVASGAADLVFLGRQLLRDPYWPLRSAPVESRKAPAQYARAFAG
jgi:2,4-dienoyl-CoA reductase-like NADH-dependent reductase (Old Yellow Enzyme family)